MPRCYTPSPIHTHHIGAVPLRYVSQVMNQIALEEGKTWGVNGVVNDGEYQGCCWKGEPEVIQRAMREADGRGPVEPLEPLVAEEMQRG